MHKQELISVILPCFNGEATLEETLNSINSQNLAIELVFINDGSTDRSLEIFKKYKFNENIHIKLLNRDNKGFLFSLDEGIRNASGNYIARIDADDIWCSNHLELIMNEFRANNDLVLVGSNAEIINNKGEIIGTYELPQKHEQILKFMLKDSPFIHSSVIYKKQSYLASKGYLIGNDLFSTLITDYHLWFELSKLGKCKNIPEKTLFYRRSSNSMSRSPDKQLMYKARLRGMKIVSAYYTCYPVYSFLQNLKVRLRIIQYYLISAWT